MCKRDRSLCSGKGSGKHSKRGRMHAGSFGCETAFYSMAGGDKDTSDVNVKRRVCKMSKRNWHIMKYQNLEFLVMI